MTSSMKRNLTGLGVLQKTSYEGVRLHAESSLSLVRGVLTEYC